MKIKANTLILLVIAAAIIYFLFFRKPKDGNKKASSLAPEVPPLTENEETGRIYSTADPNDRKILEREKAWLANNQDGDILQAQLFADLVAGTENPGAIRQVLADHEIAFGAELPLYLQNWQRIIDLQEFEVIRQQAGFNPAFSAWDSGTESIDRGALWFDTVQQGREFVDANYFWASGSADADKSERFSAYTRDLKVVAQNAQEAAEDLDRQLEALALDTLRNKGYNFV